jgi:RNA polymerase sigma-70 factor, ECF subfamily
MKKCAEGDHNAFRDLARALGSRMFALSMRLMNGNRANAEDAVQDALIKLWRSAPRFEFRGENRGRIEAYVSTLVHNCCMDLHRASKPATELKDEMAETGENVTRDLYLGERNGLLMQGIKALPDRQRSVLLLAYFGDTPNKQIAHALKISEGAVESLLVRARRNLAQKLPVELRHEFREGEL